MAHRDVQIDPNATILDLVSRLRDDGKRLLGDEVRLAKLEVSESVHEAGRGMIWLGVSLALAFVALTALTVGLSATIGRVLTDSLWLGTLVTGVLWLAIGGLLVMRGISTVKSPSFTLAQTRRELVLTRDALAHGNGRSAPHPRGTGDADSVGIAGSHPRTLLLIAALLALQLAADPPQPSPPRTITIDQRLAADAGLRVGDRVEVVADPDAPWEIVIIAAITRRQADPSEIARDEPRVRLHLDHLQSLLGYGDRVDRFAVATSEDSATAAVRRINEAAFGFQAHRSIDIAVKTSETFLVVTRFHRAIGVITIVASAIFLLCILLIKVEERRRDVAALRLMGISRSTVLRMVVAEAAVIALVGSGLGVLIGYGVSAAVNAYYQAVYRTPLRFSIVTPDIVLFAAVLSLVLGVAAGALAALRLVRTQPLTLLGR